jgi:exo-1,4-beta-D-glucosaminidase
MKEAMAVSLSSRLFHGFLQETPSQPDNATKLIPQQGWQLQSTASIQEPGEVLSSLRYQPHGWYTVSVPSTVFGALIENKVYPDPYIGMNLRLIPGAEYPIGAFFANFPMPDDSPFRVPWWYRGEFEIPPGYHGKKLWLNFRGINYRANIWLNGYCVADVSKVVGCFRFYEFDVSGLAKPGEVNALAVEVFAPGPDDLGINWVDINPAPPDKNMGLWQEVFMATSGPVRLRNAHVISHLELPSRATAHLTVNADLHNASDHPVTGVLAGRMEDVAFEQDVELRPHEWKRASFIPEKFRQLNISNPRLWWPWQLGAQTIHEMKIGFKINDQISDTQQVRFGIREVTSELTAQGYRLFRVNGEKILIRGAGWWDDMLLRYQSKRQEAEIQYATDMHLNCLRMDGKFGNDQLLDLADQYGILLMPGWCCGDHWERWENWKEEDYAVADDCLRDRIRWFRNHPSVMCWLNGDDNSPPRKVAEMYLNTLKDENWPNPVLGSKSRTPAPLTGSTGMKGGCPYYYVPPSYWLIDKHIGGGFGFNPECSPGPAIPVVESLRKFIPTDHLWPIDEYWDFHAGGRFKDIRWMFTEALNSRYGPAKSLDDFIMKAQVMAYEGERAMYEAYGRNKYTSTGVIHQMLNNAWPSLLWQLFDYYLQPSGAYFGTKKACEPLHVQYSYDDQSIVIVNSLYREFGNVKIKAQVLDRNLKERFSREVTTHVPPDSSTKVLVIPELDGLTTTYFVRLSLNDSDGKPISSNFYWLSTKPDVLDYETPIRLYTPTKSYADLTALSELPSVQLRKTSETRQHGKFTSSRVTVENPTRHLAFFIILQIRKGRGGEEVLPVLWEDNYFSLIPGEKKEVTATYQTTALGNDTAVVRVSGWNISDDEVS